MSIAQFSEEAEESVLGAMMQSSKAVVAVTDRGLRAHHFYKQSRGLIFDAIILLDDEGEKADTVTVARRLREAGKLEAAGGVTVLSTLVQMCPAVSNAGHYAQIVLDTATERNLHRASLLLAEVAAGSGTAAEKVADAEAIIAEAVNVQGADYAKLGEQMNAVMLEVKEAHEEGKPRTGMKTGFHEFDKLTNGMKRGDLVTVAARPGMGKSMLAQNVSEFVAIRDQKVCIFSLEMAPGEIGLRMVSSLSKVPHDKVTRGVMSGEEWAKVQLAHKRIEGLPIFVVDGTPNVTELRARARRLQRAEGLDLLVIDYLQLLSDQRRGGRDTRENEISRISRALKLLALELGIPIIALAQLNRGVEMRQNKRPVLADLRDSGSIEQDSDIVAFIYRDEYYSPDSDDAGVAEIIVSKQRAGAQGRVRLRALLETCRFVNQEPSKSPAAKPEAAVEESDDDLSPEDIPF